MDWVQIKSLLLGSGASEEALHIVIGVAAQFLVAAVLRVTIAHPVPWLAILAAAVANEWYDLSYDIWPNRDEQWAESARDIFVTILLPSALLIAARLAPGLLVKERAQGTAPPHDPEDQPRSP